MILYIQKGGDEMEIKDIKKEDLIELLTSVLNNELIAVDKIVITLKPKK